MINKCYGCGATLQSENSNKAGYINTIKEDEGQLCQRCYRMKHHNEYHSHYLDNEYFIELIRRSITRKNLVLLVVDLFDINASLNPQIISLIKNNPVMIVATKRDLILKSVNDNKVKLYLRKLTKKLDLNVVDVLLTSANKKHGIDDVLDSIFKFYEQRDVFIVGATNTGKSSLVNALINSIEKSDFQITISNYPGTTLDSIQVALEDDIYLFDTPGLVIESQMIHQVDIKDYKYFQMKSEVKGRVYQLNEEQSLFFGGLACFSFVSGTKTGFSVYLNSAFDIHRTKYENRIDLFDNHLEDNTLLPKLKENNDFSHFKVVTFDLSKYRNKVDIVITGLGWVSFMPVDQIIEVAIPSGCEVILREAII
ncbi:MAG: ribosome biogenesis GTPase YqeH [Erysipelotrichales bacterium]